MSRSSSSHIVMLVLATLTLSFAAIMTPAGDILRWLRPNLVLMVVIFWVLHASTFGIGAAWLAGLVQDGVSGNELGVHALSFTVIAYILLLLHHRIRMFGLLQQMLLVFSLLCFDQWTIDRINSIAFGSHTSLAWLGGAMIGALLWPVLCAVLGPRMARRAGAL